MENKPYSSKSTAVRGAKRAGLAEDAFRVEERDGKFFIVHKPAPRVETAPAAQPTVVSEAAQIIGHAGQDALGISRRDNETVAQATARAAEEKADAERLARVVLKVPAAGDPAKDARKKAIKDAAEARAAAQAIGADLDKDPVVTHRPDGTSTYVLPEQPTPAEETITVLERRVLETVWNSEFHNGVYPVGNAVWVATAGMGRQAQGAVASCVKKGYLHCEGKGREAIQVVLEKGALALGKPTRAPAKVRSFADATPAKPSPAPVAAPPPVIPAGHAPAPAKVVDAAFDAAGRVLDNKETVPQAISSATAQLVAASAASAIAALLSERGANPPPLSSEQYAALPHRSESTFGQGAAGIGPTKLVWHIADAMKNRDPNVRRRDIVAQCVLLGGAWNMVRTQVQRWKQAREESERNAAKAAGAAAKKEGK